MSEAVPGADGMCTMRHSAPGKRIETRMEISTLPRSKAMSGGRSRSFCQLCPCLCMRCRACIDVDFLSVGQEEWKKGRRHTMQFLGR